MDKTEEGQDGIIVSKDKIILRKGKRTAEFKIDDLFVLEDIIQEFRYLDARVDALESEVRSLT